MEPIEQVEERDVVQLVDACRRGDRDAQHAIYRQFVRQVHSLASRIAGPNDADDVTQNAFIQLFRTLDQFRGDANFQTWLYRLTVNEALGQRRRNRRRPATPLVDQNEARTADRSRQTDDRELLERALNQLPDDLRAVFVLREVERLSYRELAEVCDIPAGTVASKLNRARQELRKLLTAMGWED